MTEPTADLVGSLTSLIETWRKRSDDYPLDPFGRNKFVAGEVEQCADELDAILRSFPHQHKEEDPTRGDSVPSVGRFNTVAIMNPAHDPLRRAVDKAFEKAADSNGILSRHALTLALRDVFVTGPCDHHPNAMHTVEYLCEECQKLPPDNSGETAAQSQLRAFGCDASDKFSCKAHFSKSDPPQDCGWPTCGCDPYAQRVIDALAPDRVLPDACPTCGARWSCAHEEGA